MDVIVRNRLRLRYLRSDGQWDIDPAQAVRFGSAASALEAIRARGLNNEGVEIVWKSRRNECDWVLWPPAKAAETPVNRDTRPGT